MTFFINRFLWNFVEIETRNILEFFHFRFQNDKYRETDLNGRLLNYLCDLLILVSVAGLHECATSEEELMYRGSSCSAPPDLLLSSNEPQLSTTGTVFTTLPNCDQESKRTHSSTGEQSFHAPPKSTMRIRETQKESPQPPVTRSPEISGNRSGKTIDNNASDQQGSARVRLDEFTCDVSIDDGPKQQPIQFSQFSFTLYDLDGHGKITKDVSSFVFLPTHIFERYLQLLSNRILPVLYRPFMNRLVALWWYRTMERRQSM